MSPRECATCHAWYSDRNTSEPRCATCRQRVMSAGFQDNRMAIALIPQLWAALYKAHRQHTYVQED